MKATQKFNRKEIMTRAWYFYRRRCEGTFADALRDAWKIAKEAAIDRERQAARKAEYDKKYAKRDKYFANLYSNRNDWQVSYGYKYSHL